jgi:hypothetical protein
MALCTTKLHKVTEWFGIAVTLLVHIQEVLSLILDRTSGILTEVFCGSAKPLQANVRIVP